MKVPSPTQGNTRPTGQGLGYLRPGNVDLSGISQGLAAIGQSAEKLELAAKVQGEKDRAEKERLQRFDALNKLNGFQLQTTDLMTGLKKEADPAQANFVDQADQTFTNHANKFVSTLPPELQEEFRVRVSEVGQKFGVDARQFQQEQTHAFYKTGIDDAASKAKIDLEQSPEALEANKRKVDELIDASNWSDIQKAEAKRSNAATLEGITYRKKVEEHNVKTQGPTSELVTSIKSAAQELGINPVDLATAISYETGGKFSTSIRGGKNNRHIGLIQFGDAEQLRYGARQGQSYADQMQAVVAYLKDRGLKPGMGLMDIYSTINAGRPGKYGASDRPGMTVASHVEGMADHQAKAQALFGGNYKVPDDIDNNPRFLNVPYEDRVALRGQANTNSNAVLKEMEDQRKAQSAAFINNFKLGVFDGTLGQRDLDEARELGVINDFEDVRAMQGMIDEKNKEGEALRAVQTKLGTAGSLWDLTNDDDKKLSNTWFGQSGNAALAEGDQGYFNNTLKPFVSRTHMIPPDAIGMLDSMTRTTNAKQSLFALNALADLHNTEPDAYERQVPEQVQNNVEFWEARKNLFPEKETLDIIGGRMTSENRNARTALDKEADTFLSDPKNDNYTTFDSVLKSLTPDTFRPMDSNAQSPVYASARLAMQDEWKTLLKENYIKSGDWQMAQDLSVKQLQRTWGTTEFGGRKTLMKWPPEKVGYKPVLGSMSWIEDQTREELHIQPEVPIQLISDDVTQSQFFNTQKWNAGKGGTSRPTPPSYLVAVQGEDGWKLATDGQGRVIRQHFELKEKHKIAEEADFQIKEMEDDLDHAFTRLQEAQEVQVLTGVDVPQELRDDYKEKKAAVEARKESIVEQTQDVVKPSFDRWGRPLGRQQLVPEGYPSFASGMLRAGNIDLINRPIVEFGEGEKGTVRSISIEQDGNTILVPTIVDGKLVSDDEAIRHYETTGEHLGIFYNEKAANEYAKRLSDAQAKRLGM